LSGDEDDELDDKHRERALPHEIAGDRFFDED